MDMQNVKSLEIPEGMVKTIHDKDSRLLWGAVGYDTKYEGDTFQQTYSGKNLAHFAQNTGTADRAGIVFTVNSYSQVTMHGTSSNNQWTELVDPSRFLQGISLSSTIYIPLDSTKTYTLSAKILSGTITGTLPDIIVQQENSSSAQKGCKPNASVSFTGSDGIYRMWIRQYPETVATNAVIGIQIEENNQATTYEPYVGGIPSPNPSYPQDIQVVTGEQTVQVSGKNLWDNLAVNYESNGIMTVKNTDGSYTISGTATSTWATTTIAFVNHLSAGTYTMSVSEAQSFRIVLRMWDKDGKRHDYGMAANKTSLTITTDYETASCVWFIEGITNGTTYDTNFFIMLEQGSTATTYEPYQNQTYYIGLGSNLVATSDFEMGGMTNGVKTDSDYRITNANNPLAVLPNTKYTVSVELGSGILGFRVGVHQLNVNKGFISDSNWQQLASGEYTFTTGSSTRYIALVCSLSTTSATVTTGGTEDTTAFTSVTQWLRGCTVWVEKGDAIRHFAPIELCKIGNYQDYIYKSGSDWYVHKAILKLNMGDITGWGADSPGNMYCSGFQNTYHVVKDTMYSNIFTYNSTAWSGEGKFGVGVTGAIWIMTGDPTLTMGGNVPAWLANRGAIMYAIMATPTDTKITDTTLISELEAIHEWLTRYGYIPTVSGNLPLVINQTNLT